MALQTSGPISLGDIQSELGGSNPISISEYAGDVGKSSGQTISFADFYGVSNAPVLGLSFQNSASSFVNAPADAEVVIRFDVFGNVRVVTQNFSGTTNTNTTQWISPSGTNYDGLYEIYVTRTNVSGTFGPPGVLNPFGRWVQMNSSTEYGIREIGFGTSSTEFGIRIREAANNLNVTPTRNITLIASVDNFS